MKMTSNPIHMAKDEPNRTEEHEDHLEHKNPIYDSMEDDVAELEKFFCSQDTNFNSVTKETWRDVISPNSSISSIYTSDEDDEDDFSGYISHCDKTQSFKDKNGNSTSNNCDNKSLNENESLNESIVSLQEINLQIGIAEELVLTPNSRLRQAGKLAFGNLETIHEDKYLHTPPKNGDNKSKSKNSQDMLMTNFLDRLERD